MAHGIKYEPTALQEYEKFMFNRKSPVSLLKSGLGSNRYPLLGATPDAKIVDYGCSVCLGLGEVKCPHTQSHVIPLDPNLLNEITHITPKFKDKWVYQGPNDVTLLFIPTRLFTLRRLPLNLSSGKTSELRK